MKDNIRDFVDNWKQWDAQTDPANPVPVNWGPRFREAGYYSVRLGSLDTWGLVHPWCEQHIGQRHYTWAGSTFWFETEQAAALFALRWA